MVFLRGGYRLGADLPGLTAGVGFAVPLPGLHLRADYAYSAFGEYFGAVHRFTIGVQRE